MQFKFFNLRSKAQADLLDRIAILEQQLSEASLFVNQIEKGNFHFDIPAKLQGDELGEALASMKEHLTKISAAEEKRNWLNTGLATFSDILRNKKSLSLNDLADDILLNLVKYVGANQGAIFIVDDLSGEIHLKMIACYAYERKKYMQKTIAPGEGLTGQCFLEKQPIFLKQIPQGYTHITSGLGGATPRTLYLSPLQINEQIYGVIEIASLSEFQQHHLEFVNKLSENIAATIKSVKESEQTVRLLTASQQQAEELRAQEEEMRQNMEEMQATQEEMKRKSDELSRATAEMTGIISGIDATMATIEFLPDGTIVKANSNFLKTMKCELEDIQGNHHRMFVPDDIKNSSEYLSFWKKLARGEANTGIFRRVALDGTSVWLNAIYSPMKDGEGRVIKIVKFATDITAQQEMIAENKGVVNAINSTMAVIEFTKDGIILTANDNFLQTMKYPLDEIKGKHHRMFVSPAEANSAEYNGMWRKLAAGESLTGTFTRINKEGRTVKLKAIYNPIKNASGSVVKVVKFATVISDTEQLVPKRTLAN